MVEFVGCYLIIGIGFFLEVWAFTRLAKRELWPCFLVGLFWPVAAVFYFRMLLVKLWRMIRR